MKKFFVLLLVVFCFNAGYSQKSGEAPVITRYMMFTGTVDKYPVTFHLHQVKNEFSGCYYYNSTEAPIFISGVIDNKRFLKLTYSSEDDKSDEVLEGVFKDSVFSGTWSYKGKMLPFRITQKKDSSGLMFDYIWTSGTKKLEKKHDYEADELSYDAATVWPTAGSSHAAANLIKQIIREAFGEKSSQEEIGKIFIRQKNALLNAVKNDDQIEVAESSQSIHVEYRNAQLLTLGSYGYTYSSGAAHPNSFTYYTCVDLVHNRKLNITDVLDTVAGRTVLYSLLEKKFRVSYKVKKEEKISDYLFNDEIGPNNNFLLTSKGIEFNYNAYEVGPYALGGINLYIPFKEIAAYLKPEFKQLISSTP